jgi:hypothetical protein
MKSESEQWKIGVLFVCFVAIALIINSFFLHHKFQRPASPMASSQMQPPSAKSAEQIATDERASFLARYVNAGFERKAGVQAVAVIATTESGQQNRALSDALTQKFKADGFDFQPSFFKPAFITDGLFDKAFNGSSLSLPLSDSLNGLLLARESIQFEKNDSALANTITAHARIDVATIPISKDFQSQTWTLTANGAGFSQGEARANAEERLQKQIVQNTAMTLIK